ncbi:TetR/AcrR family transcriptional regulator [Streptomyces sp. NPDC002018]|uniref:TetR/AcrR family transcriptional regulator n=1 Tax=Streptomyces sp. NPDC002018 TaxID=3364629 RepID=UPI0036C09530
MTTDDASAPRPSRRRAAAPRKGDLREQAVLDAAERLLTSTGYEAMTVADIAAGAGLTRGALYFYFGSKQEVVTALVARTVERLWEKSRVAQTAEDPRHAIGTAMARTVDLWHEHGLVMRTAIDLSLAVPEVGALWDRTAALFIEAITAVLERAGVRAGDLPDQSAAMATALCWMIERSFYQASRISREELERASATCEFVWLRCAGLA